MKNPFKPQDRVAVYYEKGRRIGIVHYVCENTDFLYLHTDAWDCEELVVHYRQCRRLVKKKRREVWVDTHTCIRNNDGNYLHRVSYEPFPGATKFREVKE